MQGALVNAISTEIKALQAFIAILEEEQKLLISANADAIVPLLDRKTALIAELGSAGQSREAALLALGVSNNRESLDTYFASASDELQIHWQQLMAMAQAANQLNTTNGTLINTRLQHNQQALAILMNAAGVGNEVPTYGPDGHQKHGSGTRTLGSA